MENKSAYTKEEFAVIGKVTVSGSIVEELIYSIAESLAVETPRKASVSVAAEKIKDRLREAGVPPWASVTAEQIRAWLTEAKAALSERNDVVHSISMAQYNGDKWEPMHQSTGRKTPMKPRDTDRWEAIRQRLGEVAESGLKLDRGLMAQLAPGIHYTVYGEDAGTVHIYHNPDTGWPSRPTEEQAKTWLDEFDARYLPSA